VEVLSLDLRGVGACQSPPYAPQRQRLVQVPPPIGFVRGSHLQATLRQAGPKDLDVGLAPQPKQLRKVQEPAFFAFSAEEATGPEIGEAQRHGAHGHPGRLAKRTVRTGYQVRLDEKRHHRLHPPSGHPRWACDSVWRWTKAFDMDEPTWNLEVGVARKVQVVDAVPSQDLGLLAAHEGSQE
jgi:hypothetical protein